jgi:hypothetical protein
MLSKTQPLKLKGVLGKKLMAPEIGYQKIPLEHIERQMAKTTNMSKQLRAINL